MEEIDFEIYMAERALAYAYYVDEEVYRRLTEEK